MQFGRSVDRRTNHHILDYGVTPSVLLWFEHLLCQGCDRPVGVAADRVAGSAIDADLSIGDRVVTYSVTSLKEEVYGVRCTVNVVVLEGNPANLIGRLYA